MKRLAVLISGNGSNLQALIDHTQAGDSDAQIVVVVSNRPDAYGLVRAEKTGIPVEILSLEEVMGEDRDRSVYNTELAGIVAAYAPDLVVLAGWMLILAPDFLEQFPNKVINLHPAMPGAFPGTHAIERAHAAFKRGEIKHTGVMVHRVIAEVDAGSVIATESVPIYRDDSVSDLEERVHIVEHRLIVAAVDMLVG